jgi:hypothetical protein
MPNQNSLDYEKASSVIREKLEIFKFVSPSTYMPIPIDAPPEIPRMQMLRKDQSVKMTFSKINIDVAINDSFLSKEKMYDMGQTKKLFLDISRVFVDSLDLKFNRIAIICSQKKRNDNPEEYIAKKLLSINENFVGININYSTREDLDGIKVNIVKDYSHGFFNSNDEKVIVVNHEVNNEPENRDMEISSMEKVYDFAVNKIDRFDF